MSRYTFGTGTATFWICAHCGVVPAVTCEIDGRLYAVVNVNTFEDIDPASVRLTTTRFDDESTEMRLERRRRTWIADVTVDGAPE